MKEIGLNAETVDHPLHYNISSIEVIDAIEAWELGFNDGNAVKYIARHKHKHPDKPIEDLEKALWYIQREIDRIKGGGYSKVNTFLVDRDQAPLRGLKNLQENDLIMVDKKMVRVIKIEGDILEVCKT